MPVVATSSYNTVDAVLKRIRTILNDSEVVGGDVITNTAPFTFDLVNAGYERVQIELANVGIETLTKFWWIIGLPAMPIADPEGRLTIDDAGTEIIYPNGVGNVFLLVPQLPTDLVVPTKIWERQNNTSNFPIPVKRANIELASISQQQYLCDWTWTGDQIRMRGCLQTQDIKVYGEKALPQISAPTDPVPIRGVLNSAAYHSACVFCESRGGMVAPQFQKNAADEMALLQNINTRQKQHKQIRRRPYNSNRGGWGSGSPI